MHLDEFLLAAVILLTATAMFVSLFKRLGLGSVLGFLAAGVILGPSGFAITEDVEGLRHFTELGIVLFLFIHRIGNAAEEVVVDAAIGFWSRLAAGGF